MVIIFTVCRPVLVAFFLLIFAVAETAGQQQIPMFKTPADSAEFAAIVSKLKHTEKLMIEADKAGRDSLMLVRTDLFTEQMRLMSTGVVGFRTIYSPDPSFTSYRDFVKDGNPATVRTLTITGGSMKVLPDSLFLCPNLETLELVNWKLDRLPKQLGKLRNLKEITILNNQPSSTLRLPRNTTVTELNFRGEAGDRRLPRSYRKFRALETLDVSRNQLTSLPNTRGCKRLKRVTASFNNITLEDLRGRQATSLTDLNLSNNKVRRVPESIGRFESLKKLSFNNNQVEYVSNKLSSLRSLEEIHFYKNKLQSIPEPVYSLPKLKVIDLYFNEIEKADVRLNQMKSLEVLYLSNNRIVSLPDNLGQMEQLRELYLHNNRLINLPPTIGTLPALTVLRVNDNSLLEFPPFLFQLEKLENLDISHNEMTSLPLNNFTFTHLRMLSVVGNPWDAETKNALPDWADQLRKKYKTVVHLNTFTDQVE